MLRFIFGKSGFGKTDYIRNKALELSEKGEKVILLVPDQMSFETEKFMIFQSNAEIASKIDVFHFDRLCEEIFRTYGGISEKRIDESGRSLVMSLAVSSCKDQLELYEKTSESDLTALMLQAVSEFKNCGISANDLMLVTNELDLTLSKKVYEIALIYNSFETILSKTYIEPTDLQTRAGEVLRSQSYFKNKTVMIDGFEGFDFRKLSILKSVFYDADDIYISLCLDDVYSEENNSIFTPIRITARKLMALARETNRKIAPFITLDIPHRFKNDELLVLEEKIFRQTPLEEKEICENIDIFEAGDLYKEVEYVSATIKELVRQGYRYGDMSIICRNDLKFTNALENSFLRWEIPAFISRPRALDSSPLVRLVISAFNILEFGFKTEELLSLAKTGLCGLSIKEISELENYLYLWKINGSQWLSSFTKSPFGFDKKELTDELDLLEVSRHKLIAPLIRFKENCQNGTGLSISTAIYTLLEDYSSAEIVLENCQKFEQLNMPEEASQQSRVWEILMELLDKFATIINEQEIDHKKYGRLLRDILAKEEMMDIPLRLDTVMFGTADNMKHSSKIIFLLGCVQDEFPLIPKSNGIFSLSERMNLIKNKVPFESNAQNDILLERFYTYMSACSASEKLFLSYHTTDSKTEHIKSETITQTLDIFDVKTKKNLPIQYFASMPEPLFSACAVKYQDNDSVSQTLKELVSTIPDFSGRFNSLKRVAEHEPFSVDNQTASSLFSNNTISPSQIETYFHCKFQYFCKYGLSAREKSSAEVDVLQYGTLMHYLFEVVVQDETYLSMDEGQIKIKVGELVEKYCDENMGGKNNLSVFDLYRFKRMIDTAVLLILRLIEEIKQSQFKPKYLELKLKNGTDFPPLKIKTPNGNEVLIGGIIDRVDIYEKDEKKYVRIIDYKTGSKDFKLNDVLDGLSLQMLVYLSALSQKGYLPAGALYMPSAYPIIASKNSETTEKIEKSRNEKMRMKGIILDDEEIVRAMEKSIDGKFIPLSLRSNGNYYNKDSLYTNSEMQNLFKYTQNLISSMADNLLNGKIDAQPLMNGKDSCSWCPYKSVCGSEDEEVEKITIKKADAMKIIKEATDEDVDTKTN